MMDGAMGGMWLWSLAVLLVVILLVILIVKALRR